MPETAIVALVRDLILSSRIAATARAQNVAVRFLRDPEQLINQPAQLLLVDLNQRGCIAAASEWKRAMGGKVIGFVSHVDTGTINEAKGAGIDRVMARSGFVEELPSILNGFNS